MSDLKFYNAREFFCSLDVVSEYCIVIIEYLMSMILAAWNQLMATNSIVWGYYIPSPCSMAVYERTTGIITIIITVATTVQPRNDQNRKRSITMATCCHSLIISASWSSSSLLATMIFRYLSISSMTVRRLMSGFDVSINDVVLYSKLQSLPWLIYSCPGLQLPWRPLCAVLLPMFILVALNSATGERLFM